eukprot:222575-Chlamydomonas_euryale.AAC.1
MPLIAWPSSAVIASGRCAPVSPSLASVERAHLAPQPDSPGKFVSGHAQPLLKMRKFLSLCFLCALFFLTYGPKDRVAALQAGTRHCVSPPALSLSWHVSEAPVQTGPRAASEADGSQLRRPDTCAAPAPRVPAVPAPWRPGAPSDSRATAQQRDSTLGRRRPMA